MLHRDTVKSTKEKMLEGGGSDGAGSEAGGLGVRWDNLNTM